MLTPQLLPVGGLLTGFEKWKFFVPLGRPATCLGSPATCLEEGFRKAFRGHRNAFMESLQHIFRVSIVRFRMMVIKASGMSAANFQDVSLGRVKFQVYLRQVLRLPGTGSLVVAVLNLWCSQVPIIFRRGFRSRP